MTEAEAAEIRLVLALLNDARKARELGNTDAVEMEAEARAILAKLLASHADPSKA